MKTFFLITLGTAASVAAFAPAISVTQRVQTLDAVAKTGKELNPQLDWYADEATQDIVEEEEWLAEGFEEIGPDEMLAAMKSSSNKPKPAHSDPLVEAKTNFHPSNRDWGLGDVTTGPQEWFAEALIDGVASKENLRHVEGTSSPTGWFGETMINVNPKNPDVANPDVSSHEWFMEGIRDHKP